MLCFSDMRARVRAPFDACKSDCGRSVRAGARARVCAFWQYACPTSVRPLRVSIRRIGRFHRLCCAFPCAELGVFVCQIGLSIEQGVSIRRIARFHTLCWAFPYAECARRYVIDPHGTCAAHLKVKHHKF